MEGLGIEPRSSCTLSTCPAPELHPPLPTSCSSAVSSDIRKCDSAHFVLLGVVLALLGPLNFHVNFRISSLVSEKKPGELAMEPCRLHGSAQGCCRPDTLSLTSCEDRVFPSIL